ncbi:MAG: hypothetical protein U0165_13330 [Polyangiaceae bacterium]
MATRVSGLLVGLFAYSLIAGCASGNGATGATEAGGAGGTGTGGSAGASAGSAGAAGTHAGTAGAGGSAGTAGAAGTGGNAGTGAVAGSGGTGGNGGTGGLPTGQLKLCVLNDEGPFDACVTPAILDYGTVPVSTTEMRMFRYDNDTGQNVSFTNAVASGSLPQAFTVVTSHYVDDPNNPGTPLRTVVAMPTVTPQGGTLYFEVSFTSDQTGGPLPADTMLVTAAVGADPAQLLAVPIVGQKSGCTSGLGDCDGLSANGCETNIFTSLDHCGGCDSPCAPANAAATCSQGQCLLGSCSAPFDNCDMDDSNGCEADLFNSMTNCGSCGTSCLKSNTNAFCNGGNCNIIGCDTGYADCNLSAADGCETNVKTSLDHCGGCNLNCALAHASESCVNGTCTLGACNAGYVDCDNDPTTGCEVDTLGDPLNCGGCNSPCVTPNATPSCDNGVCGIATCASGYADCNNDPSDGCEINLKTDVNNCSSCGHGCDFANAGETCIGGTCIIGNCAVGFANCNGNDLDGCEVNLDTSLANCGGCNLPCALPHAGEACVSGQCTITTCDAGWADCNNTPGDGCEVNTNTSLANCGGCDQLCDIPNANETCTNGSCVLSTCNPGTADCNSAVPGCETDINTSLANCGGCNQACDVPHASESCVGGVCKMGTCDPGFADCNNDPSDGCEVNTKTTLAHCGGCGQNCDLANASESCVNGACTLGACNPNYENCNNNPSDGCEINTSNSLTNCGGCGQACDYANAAELCLAGTCVMGSCNAGFLNCNGNNADGCEINSNTSLANCGGCNLNCAFANAGAQCLTGNCVMGSCNAGFKDCNGSNTDGCEININTSLANCGGCNLNCDLANAAESCVNGACTLGACNAGYKNCNNNPADGCEINSNTDVNNCGACGQLCDLANAAESCVNGTCTLGACSSGFGNCNNNPTDGCETNLTNNASNCGACGTVCNLPNAVAGCTSSNCTVSSCNAGFKNCNGIASDGCEINTTNDVNNCGGCGIVCSAANGTAACVNSACVVNTCNPGFADCNNNPADGCEINTTNNPNNCNGCGIVCSVAHGTASCTNSVCGVASCNSGYGNCNGLYADGCETNTTTDSANCGTCGTSCAASCTGNVSAVSCSAGACKVVACTSSSYLDLDGLCSDGCECTINSNGGTSCAAATDLLTVAIGGSTTATSNIANSTERWYKVTFTGNTSAAYHPHVKFSSNPNNEFQFDITSNCSGSSTACLTEGSVSSAITDWEVSNGNAGSGNTAPVPAVGNAGVIYIHVFRKTGATKTCNNFTLAITN